MNQNANVVESWCKSLENVLSDGDALQAFLSWARSENAEHPLRFHFSVVAYKEMIKRKDEKSAKLAKEIYKKYLDQHKGVCQFVELEVREQVGQKLDRSELNDKLFDACLPYIHAFLQKQHAQFVTSDAFIELVNLANTLNRPSTSSAAQDCSPALLCTPTMGKRLNSQVRKHKDFNNLQKLTPEILLRSQRERELILGQSFVEKMFQPPLTKFPYVCHANTSKNDSAVSSNFSSEANSHHKRASNYSSSSQPSRPQPQTHHQPSQRLNVVDQRVDNSGSGFRHDTEEGRREFANALLKRLHELDEKISRSEQMNEQIQRINKQTMFSARDVVISSEITFAPYGVVDEDDDLNNYVKQKMVDDSSKPSPLQQQSPAGIQNAILGKTRRRSPKSCSPEYFPSVQQSKFYPMSQSYFDSSSHPELVAAFHAQKFAQYPRQVAEISTSFGLDSKHNDYDEDTSGIGSMATTSQFSGASNYHFKEQRKERHSGQNSKSNAARRSKMSNDSEFANFSSLPRQRNSNNTLMRISYKGSDGVPVVAHVSRQKINFRDFRRYLSISSKSRKQFFFKTKSDDNSAPYQLLLIDEDSAILPIFEDTIAAECRSICESE